MVRWLLSDDSDLVLFAVVIGLDLMALLWLTKISRRP